MALKTLAEQFAPLIAGRYTGSPGVLWQNLERMWNAESVVDVTVPSDGSDGLSDEILETLEARDYARFLILCDQAEELGVSPELCDLTRRALRVQYS